MKNRAEQRQERMQTLGETINAEMQNNPRFKKQITALLDSRIIKMADREKMGLEPRRYNRGNWFNVLKRINPLTRVY